MNFRLLIAGLVFVFAFAAQAGAESCPIQQQDQTAAVSHVYDADTLTLADGTRVRLIGIDAPELGRGGQPHEPYALEGRDFLRRLMDEAGHQVVLHLGEESRDRHGRLLAYLFMPDGRNINRLLLEQGYVMQVFIAPNVSYAECLRPYEDQARDAGLGIWSQDEYQPGIPSARVPASTQGAAIVYGRVVRLGESRDNLWINLEGRVALQVPKADLDAFDEARLRNLEGRKVRARGWMVQDNSRHHDWRMRINTGLALEYLD
ncbi:Endonuclease YncB, thermonuclease family [Marinospirillum celere]|uniref:Endonuclease YncB, thermonuclease family n=1 Tax=Marinospirillum celere TaxID=1122252 RepID=A0A1I1HZT0_9GAMM|nr:thermonuclease family protein [Marinospirillum celere]SFC26943.1 Endonuclease YncB, thermonuclease family [Marinospirillum celere]